jgi:hypothetical protein
MSRGWLIGAAIVVVSLTYPLAAHAQEPMDYSVTVTGHAQVVRGSPADNFISFNAPIQVPGVGLAPGTYVFTILSPTVVRVTSEDRRTVYATFFTSPVRRASATDDGQMTFRRQGNGAPPRISAWYLQNQLEGMAPLYSTAAVPLDEPLADENATN